MINRLKLKTAGIIYTIMGVITILVHLGVIIKVIPYTWVNGGRSISYESAVGTSLGGILLIIILTIIVLIASNTIKVELNNTTSRFLNILVWLIVGLSSLSLAMQFLGTTFEIVFVSFIAFINLIMVLRIALKNRIS